MCLRSLKLPSLSVSVKGVCNAFLDSTSQASIPRNLGSRLRIRGTVAQKLLNVNWNALVLLRASIDIWSSLDITTAMKNLGNIFSFGSRGPKIGLG